MRTIEATLDGKRCRIVTQAIRAFFENPDSRPSAIKGYLTIVVADLDGNNQNIYSDESIDSFTQRYEAAMDEIEQSIRCMRCRMRCRKRDGRFIADKVWGHLCPNCAIEEGVTVIEKNPNPL